MTESDWLASDDPLAMITWFTTGLPSGIPARIEPATDRKLRLFAVACCRRVWHLLQDDVPCEGAGVPPSHAGCLLCSGTGRRNRSREAALVAERYADGDASREALSSALLPALAAQERTWNRGHHDRALWGASLFPVLACNGQRPLDGYARSNFPHMAEAVSPATQAAILRMILGNPYCQYQVMGFATDRWAIPKSDFDDWTRWNGGCVLALARRIYDEHAWHLMPMLADVLEDAGCTRETLLRHFRGQQVCPCLGTAGFQANSTWVPCEWCGENEPHDLGWIPAGPPCPSCWANGFVSTARGADVCPSCHGKLRLPPFHARGDWALDLFLGYA